MCEYTGSDGILNERTEIFKHGKTRLLNNVRYLHKNVILVYDDGNIFDHGTVVILF